MADNDYREAPEIVANGKQNLSPNSSFPVKGLIYPAWVSAGPISCTKEQRHVNCIEVGGKG